MKELIRIIDDKYYDEDEPTMKKRIFMNRKRDLKKRFESMVNMYQNRNDQNPSFFKKLLHFYEKKS